MLEDRTLLSNISISDVSAVETDSGTTNLVFTVSRDDNTNQESVSYATADGTATLADGDYVQSSAILTFVAGGPLSLPVTVAVNGDTDPEATETFFVNLSNATGGAVIADGQGLATIVDDDTSRLFISDASVAEGDAGTTNLVFTVTLDRATAAPFTVDFSTGDLSAVAGADYVSASGMLNFAGTAGETQPITIAVNGETAVEADETFAISLSNATGGTMIADGEGVGTIQNDDSATLSIGNVTRNEGDAGATNFDFTVTLDRAVQGGLSVNFATTNGSAVAPGDYLTGNGTLNFTGNAGETQTITVVVNGDTSVETDELFTVGLSGATPGGTGVDSSDLFIGPAATGVIVNDDVPIPPPPAPGLTGPAGVTNDTTPTIEWATVLEAVTYDLLVYDVVKGHAVVDQSGLIIAEFTTGPLRQAAYQAFVRSVNAGGPGEWSVPRAFSVRLDPPMLTGPGNQSIDVTPTIAWDAVDGAVRYDVLVYHVATGRAVVAQAGVTAMQFTTQKLATGDHQAFVRAVGTGGIGGPYSAPLNFSILPAPLMTSPTPVTNDTTPTIQWAEVAGAAAYELLVYDVVRGTAVINETGLESTDFTPDSPLRQGLHQAFVRALDPANDDPGFYSTARHFTVVLGTTSLSVAVNNGTPTLSWAPIPGADAYELLVYDVTLGQPALLPAVTIATTLATNRLTPGTYQAFIHGFDTYGMAGPFGPGLLFQVVDSMPEDHLAPQADRDEPAEDPLTPKLALAFAAAQPSEHAAVDLERTTGVVLSPLNIPALNVPASLIAAASLPPRKELGHHPGVATVPGGAATANLDAVWAEWSRRDPDESLPTAESEDPLPTAEAATAWAAAFAFVAINVRQQPPAHRVERRSRRKSKQKR